MGYNVFILEAKDKIGGRIETLKYENEIIELGARFYSSKLLENLFTTHNIEKNFQKNEKILKFYNENGYIIDKNKIKKFNENFDSIFKGFLLN
jgi:monoamine oxidase